MNSRSAKTSRAPKPGSTRPPRWVFRSIALGLPLILAVCLEAGLRLFGVGYPTGFWLKRTHQGRSVWIANDQFTRPYFPPGMARTPQPLVLADAKPANSWRIFIFGESAALGDPEPAYGFGRVLEVLLADRHPERTIEVVNVGVTAINSHVIRQVARDCAPRGGDLWILYIGHNEVVGPFGAGTVFGARAPSRLMVRTTVAFQRTRLGQLLRELQQRLGGAKPPGTWGGMEMFLDQQVEAGDPRLSTVYESYRANLEEIIEVGRKSGAHVLVGGVVPNLRDCAPFGSVALTAEGEDLVRRASDLQAAGRLEEALRALQQAAQTDESSAELRFRLGQTALEFGDETVAREAFQRALDLDTLRFRADSRLQAIAREVAGSARRGTVYVDLAAACAAASPHGLAGHEYLYEHVHLAFEGNYLVGLALAQEAERLLGGGSGSTSWLDQEECARRLALTAWDRARVLDEMVARIGLAPFTQQLDHTQRLARLRTDLRHWREMSETEGLAQTEEIYRQALAKRPGDWTLQANHARFLQDNGQHQAAEAAWRAVVDLVPFYPPAYYGLGNALDVQGRSAESIEMFERALALQPGSVEALNGLGLALMNLGRTEEAAQRYTQAVERRPDFAEGWINLGLLQLRENRLDQARASFERALKANPSSVAAHINLGKTLGLRKDLEGAERHYREAVRLGPEQAIAHFNLANALSGRDDAGALHHYNEAVRLQPNLAEAHLRLGLALVKAGQPEQALGHFERAVQLQPGLAEARLNLGVALAKAARFAEAAEQFEECLKIDPENSLAARFLEQARARR